MASTQRVIAQRALTGEFLDWNLPLKDLSTVRELSGPGGVFGTLDPAVVAKTADDGRPLIEEWSTALYVEDDGQIRGGGLVSKVSNEQSAKVIEAPGFSGYPAGIPYADNYTPTVFEDPITIFKNLWSYVQSFPDSNLGVQVEGDPNYQLVSSGEGPYRLIGTDYRDIGDELNSLAGGVPFDYIETHSWSDDTHTAIEHRLVAGFPRSGRRQLDMRFATGENIVSYSPIAPDGDRFANDVIILGPGEGLGMLKSRAAVRDGRVRRVAVVPLKDGTQGQLDQRSASELRARALRPEISELTVVDSPHARVSAIGPGDDILVRVDDQNLGLVTDWFRVLSITQSSDRLAVLKTQRSDAFVYAAAKSYDGQPQVIIL